MKKRLYSSIALLFAILAAVALDLAFEVCWFSAALIGVFLSIGTVECYALFRLRGWPPHSHALSGGTDACLRALLAMACVGLFGAFLFALRFQEHGLRALLYLVAVAKMTDNGALFVGSLWGRHKLAPKISPAKTVEGVAGGLGAGVLTAFLLGPYCTNGGWMFFLSFGVTIGIGAVVGDLLESWIKRGANIKDSGALLPGIGGVLDLLDSVLLSAPLGFCLLKYMGAL